MTTNKGIAEEIINEGVDPDEVEEDEEGEEVSLDEELEGLHNSLEEIQDRFRKQATKLRASGKTPASKADLAELYENIQGDLLESVKDLIGAVGSGFQEVASEEDEGEEEDGTPDDNTVQVYTTLFLNVELFKKLESDSTIPDSIRESFSGMRQINEDSLKIFEDQYDAEQLKKLAQDRINEAHAKS